MKIMSCDELETARSAVQTLRTALNNQHKYLVGGDAAKALKELDSQLIMTRKAMRVVHEASPFNTDARMLTHQLSLLERDASETISALRAGAQYTGPRRSQMDSRAKSKFISEHGRREFESLPD